MDLPTHTTDQRILSELKELMEFASPGELRRSLLDLFFHCMMTSETPELPKQDELVPHFYYLINFLSEVEDHLTSKPQR